MHEGSPNKKSGNEKFNRERIKKTLRELAEMTPEQRKEDRRAYEGGQLAHGKISMTPREMEAHKQVLERTKRLEGWH